MSHYQLRYAPGSSREKAIEHLRVGGWCCMCVVGFDLWVNHGNSHLDLEEAIGAAWEDKIGDGNFSEVSKIIGTKGIAIVARWKFCESLKVGIRSACDALIYREFDSFKTEGR